MSWYKILSLIVLILLHLNFYSQNLQFDILKSHVNHINIDGYEYLIRDMGNVLKLVSDKIDKNIHSDSAEYYWKLSLEKPHPSVNTLKIFFEEAASEFNVPKELLEIIAYTESNWTQIGPSIDRGWGIMHLVDNNYCNTLNEAANILKIDPQILKQDPKQNIRGAAALISYYATQNNKDNNNYSKLEDWFEPAKKFTALINEELKEKQCITYYENLKKGVHSKTLWDEEIIIPPINDINIYSKIKYLYLNKNLKTNDYPSAIPGFISCNFTYGRNHIIDTWVHHWIGTGTYAGAISWFNNSNAQASCHFVIRSSDGEITQCVEVANTAWHCGATGYPNNSRSIGTEHEATVANPSQWNSIPMLQSSANMTCFFSNIYNIPSYFHLSPGICGHNEMPGTNTACPGSLPWNTWENLYNSCIGSSQGPQNLMANFQNCSCNNVVFSWSNSGTGWYIAVSTDPDFGQYYWKWVSGLTSYTGPAGFVDRNDGISPLVFYNGFTYYWKMWNGNNFTNTVNFTLPRCDSITPLASINPLSVWQTHNFMVSFTDSDNNNGSGINQNFYLITDYDNTVWSANYNKSFFYENFLNTLKPYWIKTNNAGNWIINNNFIEQNDIYVDNSILSAPLQQDSINILLYHFKGLISSSGNTKIAGFHFFASDSIQNNRGDSYLVSFDAKNHKVIIYKSLNNVLKIKQISPAAINTDEWYDFKIYCNSNNGTIWVFVNDKFIAAWTDAIPLTYGSYISLRTENSQAAFDEIKVYKNRKSSEIVTIGNSQQNDIRYQSVNSSFNADIFSINIDNEQNISLIDSVKIKIDWTPPLNVSVNDGMASDIDTTNITGQLTANWNLSYDTNSGINKYFVCAGISPYDSSIAMWKDNNLSNTIVFNNVNLSNGQIYYISVKTINNAGLSSISCSDGVLFQDLSSKYYFANIENKNKIFPNPVSDFIYINLSENEKVYYVKIFDNKGSEIIFSDILFNYSSDNTIKLNIKNLNLTTGVYVIVCVTNKNVIKEKFIYPKIRQ